MRDAAQRITTMYKRILVATDGSDLANKAVAHGIALAKAVNAPLSAVAVTDNWSPFEMAHDFDRGHKDPIGTYEALAADRAKQALDKVSQMAKPAGVDCTLIHVADKRPAEGIIEAANTTGAD